jgi:cytochrome c
VRDRRDGRITTYVGHDAEVRGLAFAPDGRHLASCDRAGQLVIWDLTRSPLVQTRRPGLNAGNQLAVWLSADGATAYSAFHDTRFFSFDKHGSTEHATGMRGLTRKVEFPRMDIRARADGAALFGPLEADRSVVAQWDVATGGVVREYRGHSLPVASTALSRDGLRLATRATARKDKVVRHETWVWDVATGAKLAEVSAEGLISLALSGDGRRLAAFIRTGDVAVWDVPTGRELWRRAAHAAPSAGARAASAVFDLAFSPDDRLIATAGFFDGCVQLWEAQTGEPVHGPLLGRPALTGVTFTPDGRRVVAAGYDSEVRLWDVATGQLALTLTVPGGARRGDLAFTARPVFSQRNGQLAVLNWDGLIAIWDGDDNEPRPK